MKLVLLTRGRPRHAFLARSIANSGSLVAVVVDRREDAVPPPPIDVSPATRALYRRYHAERETSENRFFDHIDLPSVPLLDVTGEGMNTPETAAFITGFAPDIVLTYDVQPSAGMFARLTARHLWSVHSGLSPWYRGAGGHFWPSYLLQPQMTGMTVEETGTGAIIHQAVAELVRGDGLHDLSCRAVLALGRDWHRLSGATGQGLVTPVPATAGRTWRRQDWTPQHLHMIYDVYANALVDRCLDGEFVEAEPQLVRAF